MTVQSVLIKRADTDLVAAIRKLRSMGFRYKKVHMTDNYFRFRQSAPKRGARYIMKQTKDPNVKLVIEL